MDYPLISEYIESIKNAEDNFATLTDLRPVLDDNGEPVMTSGNFAVVFKMKDEQTGRFHAVKCFLKEQEGRAEAYYLITEELEHVKSSFLTAFEYLDKELFVDSKNSGDSEYPILLMDWVAGETLDKYIFHQKYDGYKLTCLVNNFYRLSNWLLSQPFAHGDLKPDNILVNDCGDMVLIDYDGMYVPKMIGLKAREQGSPNYRLPYNNHTNIGGDFGKSIDDFAIIHLLLSLSVYSIMPHLIREDKEFALFNIDEFSNISETPVYKEILVSNMDTNTSLLLMLLQKCLSLGRIDNGDWELLNFNNPKQCHQYVNMEDSMCSLDNIVCAVNLAYSSMLYKDPARNEWEISKYKNDISRVSLAIEIQAKLKNHISPEINNGIHYSCLKPNGKDTREGIALNLEAYTIRYLYGIVKYKAINGQIPQGVFGGGVDAFTLNFDEYKYESYLEDFVKSQEECALKYKYLYVFDIRNFFKSVRGSVLKKEYFGYDFTNVKWYEELYDKVFNEGQLQGLNPCSEVDFFFSNLILKSLDERMIRYDGIKYFRYNDDIRIFANDNTLMDSLTHLIDTVLFPLSLELNTEKSKLIDTSKDKIELSKACFIWSCRLYWECGEYEPWLVEGKDLAYIINHDLTTTYVFKLLKDVNRQVISYNGSLDSYSWSRDSHVENLFYILKHVHKNAALYRTVSELLFEGGLYWFVIFDTESYILKKIIDVLEDDTVESFVKYWILRVLFCTEKKYYESYIKEEKSWVDPYIPKILNMLHEKFRKPDSDKLLYHISDYIINSLAPFEDD